MCVCVCLVSGARCGCSLAGRVPSQVSDGVSVMLLDLAKVQGGGCEVRGRGYLRVAAGC